jgi:hypothetical protein
MGEIVSFGAPPAPPKSDYSVFCDARKAMLDALRAFIANAPPERGKDIWEECVQTANAVRGVAVTLLPFEATNG